MTHWLERSTPKIELMRALQQQSSNYYARIENSKYLTMVTLKNLYDFCDMQELTEDQARYVGLHLGMYEDNDSRWGDLDLFGWFHARGFNLYNLLRKQELNMEEVYSGEIHPMDYYLK